MPVLTTILLTFITAVLTVLLSAIVSKEPIKTIILKVDTIYLAVAVAYAIGAKCNLW
jgi:hypothetical protein